MQKILSVIALTCLAATAAQAKVIGKAISYDAQGTMLKGYIAYDDAFRGKRPAVLVVHEWWGHNSYVRRRANMLAEQGYTALAVDMYGDGKVAMHPNDAGKFATEVSRNMPMATARFEAGMKLLRADKTVDASKLAAIGYCFGGGVVLNMARAGEPLKAVVSFHGSLSTDTPAQAGKIKARILSFTGENDAMITADKVVAFQQEMSDAKAKFRVVTYPGVQHSFTNPDADELGMKFNLPLAYNAAADQDSWQQTTVFLHDAFSGKK